MGGSGGALDAVDSALTTANPSYSEGNRPLGTPCGSDAVTLHDAGQSGSKRPHSLGLGADLELQSSGEAVPAMPTWRLQPLVKIISLAGWRDAT